ncbi:MAG: L-ribulose-5-phosphate 4-epimerase AraD [Actinomycetota bacterium]
MPSPELRDRVAEANRRLSAEGLVSLSFGNVSGVDRDEGVVVIKASGVACDRVEPSDTVVVSLDDGRVVEGSLRPSSDTPTHLVLYRRFGSIGGVVHTHSSFASAWAQAGRAIPCLGTTHADHFAGSVPITRALTEREIAGDYEGSTGEVIVETLDGLGLDAWHMPAALVARHGPFTWGTDPAEAVTNAVALEAVAAMAFRTLALAPSVGPVDDALLARHFGRKHGPDAYYGQAGAEARDEG